MRSWTMSWGWVVVVACGGGSGAAPATATSGVARPSCDAIDAACDAHEHEGGRAKSCHDLGEATTSTEATCAAQKAECLAACPAAK